MTLVDTLVWVDHLRGAETGLTPLLNENRVFAHPMVIGELACGSLGNRDEVLSLLSGLPQAPVAADQEVLALIEGPSTHGPRDRLHRRAPAGRHCFGQPMLAMD